MLQSNYAPNITRLGVSYYLKKLAPQWPPSDEGKPRSLKIKLHGKSLQNYSSSSSSSSDSSSHAGISLLEAAAAIRAVCSRTSPGSTTSRPSDSALASSVQASDL